MAIYDDKWFEIWYSEMGYVTPNHFMIITPDEKNKGEIVVIDPFENNRIVFRGKNYEEVCSWLREDEYELSEGRNFPDDGW